MKPWLISTLSCAALLLSAGTGFATVDGGITAELLGTAHEGKWAVIAETSIQEECAYAECVVYVFDTTAPSFKRRLLLRLPARYEVLKKQHCAKKTAQECSQLVSSYLHEEELAASDAREAGKSPLLLRYTKSLSVWQRAQLGTVSPPPPAHLLGGNENYEPNGPKLTLNEVPSPAEAKGPLALRLTERWTAPSFRATTEQDQFCSPSRLPSCHQEERWEDGVRTEAWICGDTPIDCSGRASLVRVEARWGEGSWSEGRSSWVEPGKLAQAAMSLIHDRMIDLGSLNFARHSVSIYTLSHSTLVVGGFAHGIYANGSWFPAVVGVPHPDH